VFIDPVRWTVRDFALLRSRRDEAAHEVLGRWRLTA
jgi:hypothetical protein